MATYPVNERPFPLEQLSTERSSLPLHSPSALANPNLYEANRSATANFQSPSVASSTAYRLEATPRIRVRDRSLLPERAGIDGTGVTWHGIAWQLAPQTPVGRALTSAARRLRESAIETPQLDAQLILAHVLERDRTWLFAHHEEELSARHAHCFAELVMRRMNHEPVAYLIQRREFYGLEFYVDQRVLIPRPETELLVDAVLAQLQMQGYPRPRVADIGTGSGAIAIAIAKNVPAARLYAIDLSHNALGVAQRNVAHHDVQRQISLLASDLLGALPAPVDVIVANLPYISCGEYETLAPSSRHVEPRLALEAGSEGLDEIARLLQQAPACLNEGGSIFLEIGSTQGEAVLNLVARHLPNASFTELRKDYNGRDRLVVIVL